MATRRSLNYFNEYIAPHLDDIIRKYEQGETLSSVLKFYGVAYDAFIEQKCLSHKNDIVHLYSKNIEPRFGDMMEMLSSGVMLTDICYSFDITKQDFYDMLDYCEPLKALCADCGRLDDEGNIISTSDNDLLYKTIIVENWEMIRDAIMNGKQIEDICHTLKISLTTFYKLRKEHSDFNEMIDNCDTDVFKMKLDDTLQKVATGFYYEETKETITENLKTGEKTRRVENTRKYYPPNMNALAQAQANIIKNDDYITSDRLTANIKRREIKLKEEAQW